MSPVSGTVSLLTAAQGAYRLQDRFLPMRVGEERGLLMRAAGFGYRLTRLTLLDLPLEVLHNITRHEVFGHGGRVRQAGGFVRRYTVQLPPPYGRGDGSIEFGFDPQETTSKPANI